MQMGTVPGVTFKVEPWNSDVGAKAKIESAWFRISGIPMEKRTEKRICYVASLVGIPLEVDKLNTKRWEYVRVKIGCKDLTKVPAVVEGLMDLHFYDFIFQREVQVETQAKSHWNTWTRNTERDEGDNPSPKKHKKGDGRAFQDNSGGGNSYEAGTSGQSQGRKHSTGFGDLNQEGGGGPLSKVKGQ
jgi:hypothetical protein